MPEGGGKCVNNMTYLYMLFYVIRLDVDVRAKKPGQIIPFCCVAAICDDDFAVCLLLSVHE